MLWRLGRRRRRGVGGVNGMALAAMSDGRSWGCLGWADNEG
jgi:hypothetical protein